MTTGCKSRQILVIFVRPLLLQYVLGLLCVPLLVAQSGVSAAGLVISGDGRPLAGVRVYGSTARGCCTYKHQEITTGTSGEFRMDNSAGVIHFFKKDFQPETVVAEHDDINLRVTLQPSTDALMLPVCGKPKPGQSQIGWGKYGIRFNVVKRAVKIIRGKPDVDYARYVVSSGKGEASLKLWFGLLATAEIPDDEQFINSVKFAQRNVVAPDGKLRGTDSWGQQRDGAAWRQTAIAGQGGAIYQNTPPELAVLFDQVVNSVCEVPYPHP